MNFRNRRNHLAAFAAATVATALASCGENPNAPPVAATEPAPAAPAAAPAPAAPIDVVADLKDCAGAVQALVGFDPIAQRDHDDPQWLPVYYAMLDAMEKKGVEFAQRTEGARAAATAWQGRSRDEQEARVKACQATYLATPK